jgi:hypothetical protein
MIHERRFETVFQPIWNLEMGTLLGVDALTRPDPAYGLSGPAEAFDVAWQLGRVHQLDVLCTKSALRSARALEPAVLLFINLSPLTLDLDVAANAWLAPAVRAGLSRATWSSRSPSASAGASTPSSRACSGCTLSGLARKFAHISGVPDTLALPREQ